jgi:rhodanese-related sulfurtransferase
LDSADEMVVFCKGGRARRALEVLASAGFRKVKNLKGGINLGEGSRSFHTHLLGYRNE